MNWSFASFLLRTCIIFCSFLCLSNFPCVFLFLAYCLKDKWYMDILVAYCNFGTFRSYFLTSIFQSRSFGLICNLLSQIFSYNVSGAGVFGLKGLSATAHQRTNFLAPYQLHMFLQVELCTFSGSDCLATAGKQTMVYQARRKLLRVATFLLP